MQQWLFCSSPSYSDLVQHPIVLVKHMAGTLKRLRRKTRASQRNYEDVLVSTLHLWMPFLLPADTREKLRSRSCTWSSAKHERMLSKRFRNTWIEHFHVIVLVHGSMLSKVENVVLPDDSSCMILDEPVRMSFLDDWWYYMVTMPWPAFILVMEDWRKRGGFRRRGSLPTVGFLDARWNADRTPALQSLDIRVMKSMSSTAFQLELERRRCAATREALVGTRAFCETEVDSLALQSVTATINYVTHRFEQ